MSQKQWIKKAPKLVQYADYIGIDGENYVITGRASESVAIGSKYSHFVSVGSLTPEGRLWSMLRALKKEQEINQTRFETEVECYFEDKAFVASVVKVLKALYSCGYSTHINVFVVLPNLVYKYLGHAIIDRMMELVDLDFRFIFGFEEVKAFGYEKLEIPIKKPYLKQIAERVEQIEKKYKIKYKKKDWDDDE